ncbi:hypothetical protein [Leifsonia naganoensis]|uniref:Uncharacterized protein n=1 Tax=Leifsonia naganoensis TaxID=150025 RepID=A0A853DKM1_9MICO|nr:hypothetical protein [Leifsonia naganoensis]NYK09646.1 hypothetical protein [Leifsonia naganoensis]
MELVIQTIDANNPFLIAASIACPLMGAVLIVALRRRIVPWLLQIVPQKNQTKVRASVYVAAFAIAAFIAGWFLALFVPIAPPALWLSILGAALLAWLVVWALLANEN